MTNKNKIGIILSSDVREFGGGERYILELYKKLKNFDITILSCNKNVNTHRLKYWQFRKLKKIEFYKAFRIPILNENMLLTVSGIKMLMNLKRFDVIYSLDQSIFTMMFLLFIQRVYHKKVILGMHAEGFLRKVPLEDTILKRCLFPLYLNINRLIAYNIQNIHVLNISQKETLLSTGYKGNIYYIPNFLYWKTKNKKFKPTDSFYALFVGRMDTYGKGIDLLKHIIYFTIKNESSIKFLIVGSGNSERTLDILQQKYKKNIELFGFVSDTKLIKLYNKANLFLLPSRTETFSLVTLEAQCFGLPVISFDIPGPQNIITEKIQGELIPPYKTREFSNAIIQFYKKWKKDRVKYAERKYKVSKIIVKKYDSVRIISQIKKMFNKI